MKKSIYKLFRKFGYKISNENKKKNLKLQQVKDLGIKDDFNNLLFRSIEYYKSIKEYYPDVSIKNHDKGLLLSFNKLKFYLESPEEFFILNEVFVENDYNFISNDKFVVFDIGMNIGISSIFFSLMDNVSNIYSFEPVLKTFNQAIYNYSLNDVELSNKIQVYNFGLGGKTRKEIVLFDNEAKGNCGIRKELSPSINSKRSEKIEISIVAIDEIVPKLFEIHTSIKKLFKIDCEGAEYEILQKLSDENLLKSIDVLMIEWHDKGSNSIEQLLIKNDFNVISRSLGKISGIIYAFKKQ